MIDRYDARRAVAATGLLEAFNEAGVLAAADVHVARRLAALAGEADERVALAAALAVRGPRLGHVCVDLATIAATASVDTDEPVDLDRAAVARARRLGRARRGERARRRAAARRRHASSTSTATGARRSGSRAGCARSPRRRRPSSTRRCSKPGSTGCCPSAAISGWPPRPRCCAASRSWPAGRARARRRRSRGSSRCSPSRPRRRGDAPPLVALAAPTGKAAARLAEAVHDEAAELAVGDAVRAHLLGLSAPRPSTACSAARRGAARCRTTS